MATERSEVRCRSVDEVGSTGGSGYRLHCGKPLGHDGDHGIVKGTDLILWPRAVLVPDDPA